jgi:hypothetical protein
MAAIVQEDLYAQFVSHAKLPETTLSSANIVFMLYQFERRMDGPGWTLQLQRVVPTTHTSLMNAILYETPPSKEAFKRKILDRLSI